MSRQMPTTVAVTGAAGFVGARVVRALRAHEIRVVPIARRREVIAERLSDIDPTELVINDLTNLDEVTSLMQQHQVDAVCHAAWSGHPRSPHPTYAEQVGSNIAASLNVQMGANVDRPRHVVFLASGGARRSPASAEFSPPSPYGWAKAATEGAIQAGAGSVGAPFAILRPSAVFGPGQNPAVGLGAASVFIDRLLTHQPIRIFGSPQNGRDFLHVDDLAEAVVAALLGRVEGAYDLGGPDLVTVGELLELLAELTGIDPDVTIEPSVTDEPTEVRLDNAPFREKTQWTPTRRLVDTLPLLVERARAALDQSRPTLLSRPPATEER